MRVEITKKALNSGFGLSVVAAAGMMGMRATY